MNLESTAAGERERQIDLAVVEYLRAEAAGATPERAVFLGRHADIAAELGQFFADRDAVTRLGSPVGVFAGAAGGGDTPGHGLSPTFPAAFGPYELLAEIGRGGMGVVYRARQAVLQRLVAIKMITPGAATGPWQWRASAMRRRRRRACSIPTSCRFSRSGNTRASRTSPWNTSREAAWRGAWMDSRSRPGRPLNLLRPWPGRCMRLTNAVSSIAT